MDVYQVLNFYAGLGIIVLLLLIKHTIVTRVIPYLRYLIQSKLK